MNPSTLSTGLKWGLIYGLVSVIFNLILYVLGQTGSTALGSIIFIIWIVFIVLALRNHYHSSTKMTYGQGLVVGLLIGLIGGIFCAVFNYAIFALDADLLSVFQEKVYDETAKSLEQRGKTADEIDDLLEQIGWWIKITPMKQALTVLITYPIIGFFLTLIPAIFFRKKGRWT